MSYGILVSGASRGRNARRAALGADEVIELGADRPPEQATPTELEQIRAVIDSWILTYSREVTQLVSRQSGLAREEGSSMFSLWAREVGATIGVIPHPAEVWEMTRSVALKLLQVAQEFAQAYGSYFTDIQDQTLTMAMESASKAVQTANEFSEALRPELLEALRLFIRAATMRLLDAAIGLGDILSRLGLAVAKIPSIPLDILDWISNNIGTVVLVGAGVLVAAAVLPSVIAYALAPSPRLSGSGMLGAVPKGRRPEDRETVLWGVKEGDEDWQETILSTQPERFEVVKAMAKKDGWGRFRVATIDLTEPPDFSKTVRRR